jgi:NACalpha-BTF3-like transcription factor
MKQEMDNTIVKFVNDHNSHYINNPEVHIVKIHGEAKKATMKALERSQIGAGRMGGNWRKILKDYDMEYEILEKGWYNDLKNEDCDFEYKVISGNY